MVERGTGRLVGIVTHRDVRFATDPDLKVYELMTRENLVTVTADVSPDEARRLLHRHRIEKLLVVDDAYPLRRPDHREGHGQGGDPPAGQQGRARAACASPPPPAWARTAAPAPAR